MQEPRGQWKAGSTTRTKVNKYSWSIGCGKLEKKLEWNGRERQRPYYKCPPSHSEEDNSRTLGFFEQAKDVIEMFPAHCIA